MSTNKVEGVERSSRQSSVKSKSEKKRSTTRNREAGSAIIKDNNPEENKLADRSSMRLSASSKEISSKDKTSKKKRGSQNAKPIPKKKTPKTRTRKRTFFEKILLSMGFHVGNVVLKDPRAIEAAQALNLQPWHLRRLKARFDKVDIDGSGNIDFEEFFESVGEQRSPFTDKLFALIGSAPVAWSVLFC